MKNKLYYFVFFDEITQKSETLQIKAKTFAEALPNAHVHKIDLNKRHIKSSWDVVKVNSKLT